MLIICLTLNFSGCLEKFSPIVSENIKLSNQNNLQFRPFAKSDSTSGKEVLMSVSNYFSFANSEEITLEYDGKEHNNGNIYVKVNFRVLPQTICYDTTLCMHMYESLVSGDIKVEFGPHGTTFNSPALLNVEIKNAETLQALTPIVLVSIIHPRE